MWCYSVTLLIFQFYIPTSHKPFDSLSAGKTYYRKFKRMDEKPGRNKPLRQFYVDPESPEDFVNKIYI
jgi:hypothetical protein